MNEQKVTDDTRVRVGVKGGGCAGYEYVLTFDKPNKKDLTFESKGVTIVVDKKSHIVIDGVVIEWSTDLSAPGPRFENPRAASTCGCSTSFSIKPVEVNSQPVWMQ